MRQQLQRRRETTFLTRTQILGMAMTACILVHSASLVLAANESTVVSTTSGDFEGCFEGNIRVFKGIPYASPPVGQLRFAAPQPYTPHSGIRQTFDYGPSCFQENPVFFGNPLLSNFPRASASFRNVSEDCLTLNIFTPRETSEKKRPVIVFIHGGGFIQGGSEDFNGVDFFKTAPDVILVTMNYRLNIYGFAYLENITPNVGILDQRFALEWIQDNIEAFGGDPDKVLLSGQSGGGVSVKFQLILPKANDLKIARKRHSIPCEPHQIWLPRPQWPARACRSSSL